jgi:hypothetical protein
VGIGLVASVPFSFAGGKGLVLYFSRKTADPNQLQFPDNVEYLLSSASLVGASFVIRKSRTHAKERIKASGSKMKALLRSDMLQWKSLTMWTSLLSDGSLLERLRDAAASERAAAERGNVIAADEPGTAAAPGHPRQQVILTAARDAASRVAGAAQRLSVGVLRQAQNAPQKWQGAGLCGPPSQPWSTVLFLCIGVFLAMLTVLKVEKALEAGDESCQFQGR